MSQRVFRERECPAARFGARNGLVDAQKMRNSLLDKELLRFLPQCFCPRMPITAKGCQSVVAVTN
jgi:hypothetical protein